MEHFAERYSVNLGLVQKHFGTPFFEFQAASGDPMRIQVLERCLACPKTCNTSGFSFSSSETEELAPSLAPAQKRSATP